MPVTGTMTMFLFTILLKTLINPAFLASVHTPVSASTYLAKSISLKRNSTTACSSTRMGSWAVLAETNFTSLEHPPKIKTALKSTSNARIVCLQLIIDNQDNSFYHCLIQTHFVKNPSPRKW